MTVKVGLLGLGFMGLCHYNSYKKVRGAKVKAICEINKKRLHGDWSDITGNIGGAGKKENLQGFALYDNARDLFADPDIDAVDICLPTDLHAKYTVDALKAGKHVICEKPMARTSAEAKKMIDAARKSKKQLYIAQCIRFWPAYATMRDLVKSGKYGKVLSASFLRLSATPGWSPWLMDAKRSGGAPLDLHVHDADFILHLLGKPKNVCSQASGMTRGRLDHIVTTYTYSKNQMVMAEGAWDFAPGFGFEMSFRLVLEKATLQMTPDLKLHCHPLKGKSRQIKLPSGDGYINELRHFADCIAKDKPSAVVTPQSAMHAVKLIEAEVDSAQTGKPVTVRL